MDDFRKAYEEAIARLVGTYGNGEETIICAPVPEGTILKTNIPNARLMAIGEGSRIVYIHGPGHDVPYCCYLTEKEKPVLEVFHPRYGDIPDEEQPMGQERDTHFQGAAKLILQALMTKYDHLPPGEWGPAEKDEFIISHFLFDFADHVIKNLHGSNLDEIKDMGLERFLEEYGEEIGYERIPDMEKQRE